jgi:hypothetical protein
MIRRILKMALPLALFCAITAALQAMAGRIDPWLPVKTFLAFLLGFCLYLCFPWRRLPRLLRPGRARRNVPILFLLFIRHFAAILGEEAYRLFRARRLAVVRDCGPLGFFSLRCAVAAVFRRTLARAERFYAAQWLRGAAE